MARLARLAIPVVLVATLTTVSGVVGTPGSTSAGGWRVGIVGDSLTLHASTACAERASLERSGFTVVGLNGKVGRTIGGGYAPWQPSWGANVAVIGLGTNDSRIWSDPAKWRTSIRSMIGRVGPTTKIVWVNVWRWDGSSSDPGRGRRQAAQFNAVLAQEIQRLGRRAVVADWAAVASHHRGWTISDGIHDTMTGCRARVQLIATALHTLLDPPRPAPTTTSTTTTTIPPTIPTTTTEPTTETTETTDTTGGTEVPPAAP